MELLEALKKTENEEELSNLITATFDDIETSIGDCRNDIFAHRYLSLLSVIYSILGDSDRVDKDFNTMALLETKFELECYKKLRKCMIKNEMMNAELFTAVIHVFLTLSEGRVERFQHISGSNTKKNLENSGVSFYPVKTTNNYVSYIPSEEKELKESLSTVSQYIKKPLADKTMIDK